MKKYLALIVFALLTTVAYSQSNYQDVVYLKNGSIIRGVIIEQVPNKSIKIETADGSVFVYQMEEIEKFTKEPYKHKGGYSNNSLGSESGYKGIVEIGYEIGVGDWGMDRIKLSFINGYQINKFFSLGFGTGLRYYSEAEAAIIPFFADFRSNFMDNKVSPYLSLGVGYSFNATNDFKGAGFLLNPTVGVSFKLSNKSSMNVGLGYEMQYMKFYLYYGYYGYYYFDEITKNSGAISINVGISF